MPLIFENDTGRDLWVAIAFEDQSCVGSKWRKEGWWKINPRSTVTVFTGPTKNRTFYYFAHDKGYQYVWEGDAYHTYLPDEAFSRCWDESGGTNRRAMKSFTATADTYTRTLYI
ncbi:DUF1036 domain-containing protein [Bacillus sp. WLY-B-L8]|uniref:DUF1036 domain-containing protein n=1 Tax=Bacillus multifaciens TaxID=3068506 RepID=UPI0027417941|nr:DUF1036 domain-containing protein [Bacillus sp. WLY-B-L8]MDP7981228.1 DUF1036 domain-containing protein [Bacillus sp. WLY-B-L8]